MITRIGMGILVAAMLAVAVPASAEEGRVPLPSPAQAKGEACVEPVQVMRRYHMVYLEHQRTETVRRGIRDGKYSLKGCVECHAAPDPGAGGEVTIEPFCDECHDYVAVTIDCFQCHSNKPAEAARRSGFPLPATPPETIVGMLRNHLEERRRP